MGVVEVNYVTTKIDMDMNASFLLDTYMSALAWADASADFRAKKTVLVLDIARAYYTQY
ncbi:hypothetical protein PINS_up023440 [Pythium insidiosum]|nr:hypothetical protein PINS_up012277 [Pythium insidiosum]GLE11132.1 hypothetical protein PINS_up023440 [Pythium insidiosum]